VIRLLFAAVIVVASLAWLALMSFATFKGITP
jgi:hypothetical protein